MTASRNRRPPHLADRRAVSAWIALTALGLAGCLTGCDRREAEKPYQPGYDKQSAMQTGVVYVLAVHPLHNPKRLFEVYAPLIDYINARLKGASLRLEASSSYAAFEEKMARRELHFCLANPYQTIAGVAMGYHVFAKMGDDDNFRGVILVRKDSGIVRVDQLVGKIVSYPAPTALAAAIMPQWFLHEHGINVMRDIDNRYVGTQESSIMNVVLGKSAASATWPLPWRAFQKEHPDLASQIEVRWETPPLVNNAMTARDNLPAPIVQQVGALLAGLHTSGEGQAILARMALSRFEIANDATYEPVRTFVRRFEAEVRPVKPRS